MITQFESALRVVAIFFAATLGLCAVERAAGQNPSMSCKPDGIIEVCTLADSPVPLSVSLPTAPPAPKVTYNNGMLAISAENVSLQDVLHAVSVKTGARIEIPPGTGSEPVFANLGPGPARDVVAALLHGSPFNYVLAGTPNTDTSLQSVVLTQTGQPPTEVAQSAGLANPAGTSSQQVIVNGQPVQGTIYRMSWADAVEKARQAALRNMARGQETPQPGPDTSTQEMPQAPTPDAAPAGSGAQGSASASPTAAADTPTPQ